MARLRLDPTLHEPGERADVPHDAARAAAWWVAAELIRRHPKELTVIETHPGGGLYDCVSVYRTDCPPADAMVVLLNVAGHLSHGTWHRRDGGTTSDGEDGRFNWFEVLSAPNPRRYIVEQLEQVEGLPIPRTTPRTTRRSIGPLVMSRLAGMIRSRREHWEIRNAYLDTSAASTSVQEWVRTVPGVTLEPMADDFAGQPAYRYWGLQNPDGIVEMAIDVRQGLAWRADGEGTPIDLLASYSANHRKLDRVAAIVAPEFASGL